MACLQMLQGQGNAPRYKVPPSTPPALLRAAAIQDGTITRKQQVAAATVAKVRGTTKAIYGPVDSPEEYLRALKAPHRTNSSPPALEEVKRLLAHANMAVGFDDLEGVETVARALLDKLAAAPSSSSPAPAPDWQNMANSTKFVHQAAQAQEWQTVAQGTKEVLQELKQLLPATAPAASDWGELYKKFDPATDHAVRLLPPGSGGELMAVMTAKQTIKQACFLCKNANGLKITMTAYTFDVPELVRELKAAAVNGSEVELTVDQKTAMAGNTHDMMHTLTDLQDNGVTVLLSKGIPIEPEYTAVGKPGRSGTGIQHSKCFMMGAFLIAGSTNWTTSSKCNAEVSLLIKLGAEGVTRFAEQNRFVTERVIPLTHTHRVQVLLDDRRQTARTSRSPSSQ